MAAIVLPRTCRHTVLIRALADAGLLNGPPEQVVLQVPEGCFISTGALSFLCGWGLRRRQKGLRAYRSPSHNRRAAAKSSVNPISAVAPSKIPGVFPTGIFRLAAAARSM